VGLEETNKGLKAEGGVPRPERSGASRTWRQHFGNIVGHTGGLFAEGVHSGTAESEKEREEEQSAEPHYPAHISTSPCFSFCPAPTAFELLS
jgi:hypothetical protein